MGSITASERFILIGSKQVPRTDVEVGVSSLEHDGETHYVVWRTCATREFAHPFRKVFSGPNAEADAKMWANNLFINVVGIRNDIEAKQERAAYEAKMKRDFAQDRIPANGRQLRDDRANSTSVNEINAAAERVPAGRYAVNYQGTLAFFVVSKPTEGKWTGWTFISRQASDTEYPIKNRDAKLGILRSIGKDPAAASKRYGLEIGHCGVCGRTLTNEDSRAAGIGPICAGKMGW